MLWRTLVRRATGQTQTRSDINVDLWPPGGWTQNELEQFVQLFQQFGNASGQISGGIRGMEVQIAISFAAGAIAAGFFGKLGEELYNTAKVWLKKLLLKKGMKHEGEENEQVEGRISIEYEDKENGFDVYYACRYSNDPELEIYLSSVPRLDAALRTACRSRLFPFDIGQSYSIYAEMQVTPRIKWDIRVHRYSENGEPLDGDQWFSTHIRAKRRDMLPWKQIRWKRESATSIARDIVTRRRSKRPRPREIE